MSIATPSCHVTPSWHAMPRHARTCCTYAMHSRLHARHKLRAYHTCNVHGVCALHRMAHACHVRHTHAHYARTGVHVLVRSHARILARLRAPVRSSSHACMNAHMCIHAPHAARHFTYRVFHTRSHARTQTLACMHSFTRTCMRAHDRAHARMHAYTHARIHAYTLARSHGYVHAWMHVHTCMLCSAAHAGTVTIPTWSRRE